MCWSSKSRDTEYSQPFRERQFERDPVQSAGVPRTKYRENYAPNYVHSPRELDAQPPNGFQAEVQRRREEAGSQRREHLKRQEEAEERAHKKAQKEEKVRIAQAKELEEARKKTEKRRLEEETRQRLANEAKEMERQELERKRKLMNIKNSSPETLRELRELMRMRYQLDVEIWNLRGARKPDQPLVELKMAKADHILGEIMTIASRWTENNDGNWTEEEWRKVLDVQTRLKAPGKRNWASNPPWADKTGTGGRKAPRF